MAVEFLSIVIFTFALALFVLGAVTWWMERNERQAFGVLMMGIGLLIAAAYAFLGSRFAIAVFGRLIITVDLPRLMATAVTYTIGVLLGFGLAGSAFLWISGRMIEPTRLEQQLLMFIAIVLVVALVISAIAVRISL